MCPAVHGPQCRAVCQSAAFASVSLLAFILCVFLCHSTYGSKPTCGSTPALTLRVRGLRPLSTLPTLVFLMKPAFPTHPSWSRSRSILLPQSLEHCDDRHVPTCPDQPLSEECRGWRPPVGCVQRPLARDTSRSCTSPLTSGSRGRFPSAEPAWLSARHALTWHSEVEMAGSLQQQVRAMKSQAERAGLPCAQEDAGLGGQPATVGFQGP